MFQAKVSKKTLLGGVLKIIYKGITYTPNDDGEVTIPDAPFIVEQTEITGGRELNKTWQEIHDHFVAGVPVLVTTPTEWDSVVRVEEDEVDVCHVWTSDGREWLSSSAGSYPTHYLY